MDGTRIGPLETIKTWGGLKTERNVLWVRGGAGCGKSTVAQTIADYFRGRGLLGAYGFCLRGKTDPRTFLRAIAYELATYSPEIAARMLDAVKDKNIISASLETQFDILFAKTLSGTAPLLDNPIVIAFDALDECGSVEDRRRLMQLLPKLLELPKIFRFLITSRPEHDIMNVLSPLPIEQLELDPSQEDVRAYLHHELYKAFTEYERSLLTEEMWQEVITALSSAAHGYFIWASTAIKIIHQATCKFLCLERLVSSAGNDGVPLDALYATALREAFQWEDETTQYLFPRVMSLVLLGKIPFTNGMIDEIVGFEHGAHSILSRILSLVAYTPGEPIRIHHASFFDYLTRCVFEPWFIDIHLARHMIAHSCFNVLTSRLHFNMGGLKSSFVLNTEVDGLTDRISGSISPLLHYICVYWAQHLLDTPSSYDLVDKLSAFTHGYLLYWFEVLSLKKDFYHTSVSCLRDAIAWIPVCAQPLFGHRF